MIVSGELLAGHDVPPERLRVGPERHVVEVAARRGGSSTSERRWPVVAGHLARRTQAAAESHHGEADEVAGEGAPGKPEPRPNDEPEVDQVRPDPRDHWTESSQISGARRLQPNDGVAADDGAVVDLKRSIEGCRAIGGGVVEDDLARCKRLHPAVQEHGVAVENSCQRFAGLDGNARHVAAGNEELGDTGGEDPAQVRHQGFRVGPRAADVRQLGRSPGGPMAAPAMSLPRRRRRRGRLPRRPRRTVLLAEAADNDPGRPADADRRKHDHGQIDGLVVAVRRCTCRARRARPEARRRRGPARRYRRGPATREGARARRRRGRQVPRGAIPAQDGRRERRRRRSGRSARVPG